MSDLQTIIPRPGEIRPDKPYRTPDRRWEEVTQEMYGSAEAVQNVRFEHDEYWNKRFFSIQNVNDQTQGKRTGVWTMIWVGTVMVGPFLRIAIHR